MPSEQEIEEIVAWASTDPKECYQLLAQAYLSMKSERDDYKSLYECSERAANIAESERDKYKEIVEKDTEALIDIKEKAKIQRPDQMTTRYIDYRKLEDAIDSALSLRDKKEE